MAETPLHKRAMFEATGPLEDRYRDRTDVFVGGNMMMFHVQGNGRKHVSPDVFVALGVRPGPDRAVWKTWEEGKLADFVLEVTSKSTRGKDEGDKKRLYERLGVREYWQYDPTGDYLDPILKGRRLDAQGVYRSLALQAGADGILHGESEVLSLHLCLDHSDGNRLRYRDPQTGEYLLTPDDKARLVESQRYQLEDKDRLLREQARALQAIRAENEKLKRRFAHR
jgi:Uma2 family endonuclease